MKKYKVLIDSNSLTKNHIRDLKIKHLFDEEVKIDVEYYVSFLIEKSFVDLRKISYIMKSITKCDDKYYGELVAINNLMPIDLDIVIDDIYLSAVLNNDLVVYFYIAYKRKEL
jgi:hypothetical protein